jgi:phosphatidylglycerophosphate synthase
MSFRESERKFFYWSYDLRNKILAPLLKLLSGMGITANHITFFRVVIFIVGVMYPLFVKGNLTLAVFVYFLGFMLLDTLDGSLARFNNSASDKGRFNDLYVDVLGYSVLIMGLAYLETVGTFILFYHVIIHGALYLISSVYKNENEKSDWIMKAEPNLTYLKFIAMTFIAVLVLFKVNVLDIVFIILNIWMTVLAFYYFIKLQRQSYKN